MTPTARTLKEYRSDGWTIQVVERWNGPARKRIDLFGFGDLVAFKGNRTALVQATSTSSMSSRRTKIIEECKSIAADWLRYGREIHVVGWAKRKHKCKNGNKVDRWTMKRVELNYQEVSQ